MVEASRMSRNIARLALLFLLVLSPVHLEAWFWSQNAGPTQAPTEEPEAGGRGEDENLAGVGAEIINVASGISKFVQAWDENPEPVGADERLGGTDPTTPGSRQDTGNSSTTEQAGTGSGVGSEAGLLVSGSVSREVPSFGSSSESGISIDSEEDSLILPTNITERAGSQIQGREESDSLVHPQCLPMPSDWPICSGKSGKSFALPNFLNHTSIDEVAAVAHKWAWLAQAGCHHGAEWFLCLLLAPQCPPPGKLPRQVPPRQAAPPQMAPHLLLPCRSFCHILQDSCWAVLDEGLLPVACHFLPEQDQEQRCPTCVSVSNRKGKRERVRMHPSPRDTFSTRGSHVCSLCAICCVACVHVHVSVPAVYNSDV